MDATPAPVVSSSPDRALRWVGWLLIGLALLGHLYAAHIIGGSRIAYTHHVAGFGLILVVTGGIIALAARFRRWRWATTLLVIGVVQALLGLWVALASSHAVGR